MAASSVRSPLSLLLVLFVNVVSTSPIDAHAGCPVSDPGCNAVAVKGRLQVNVSVEDVVSKRTATTVQATVNFTGERVVISVNGLEPGIFRPVLRLARGTASLTVGKGSATRLNLTHRGPRPTVKLGVDGTIRDTGPQTGLNIVLDIDHGIVVPMGDSE
jgi:hypothetical protein